MKALRKIENRETDFIVGTQMISKGLDLDHIDLVAIPRLMHSYMYKISERKKKPTSSSLKYLGEQAELREKQSSYTNLQPNTPLYLA